MTLTEAAQILDLSSDATAEQAEARFLELRRRLEDKIAKAPTPGLQTKYRESLTRVTEAFETLTLATDGDMLPVLEQRADVPLTATQAEPSSISTPAPVPKPTAKAPTKANREFLVVALIAVLLLGAGAWWIVHTRAQSAEKARVEAAAAAEAVQRAAEQAQLERESALAAEAEFARLRAAQAEAKIRWETVEREASAAERRLSEIRADMRAADRLPAPDQAELRARVAAQEAYVRWVTPYLMRHPARTELARLDALLAAKAMNEAAATERDLITSLAKADEELVAQRKALLTLTGRVEISSDFSESPAEVTDAYGRTQTLTTPIAAEFPVGPLEVTISAPKGWSEFKRTARVSNAEPLKIHAHFEQGTIEIKSEPADLAFSVWDDRGYGTEDVTPKELLVPPGEWTLTVSAPGWEPVEEIITVTDKEATEFNAVFEHGSLELQSEPSGLAYRLTNIHGFARSGTTPALVEGIPVGIARLEVTRPGWNTKVEELTVLSKQTVEAHVAYLGSALTINSTPSGAEVFEQDKKLGATPLVLNDVLPGAKTYVLKKEGHLAAEIKTSLVAGEAKSETVTLSPSTPVTIYVYRPIHILAGAARVTVYANGESAGSLPGGSYGKLTLPPGTVTLYASDSIDSNQISINCSPGSTLYYHIQPSLSSMRLDQVSHETGQSAVSKYRKVWGIVR